MNLELKCRMPNGNLSSFYFRYGQLESKTLGGKAAPVATLKYLYRKDGMIAGRVVDGKYQMYTYDKRGQLLQVADMQGNVAEKYVYDPAGNILSKTIAGKTTSYTYDKANQLVNSVCDGKTTHYEYDAAGRMVKEGGKSYEYGWLDKVLAVRKNDKKIASFDYQVDGQIAQAIHGDQSEEFFWDGLALIHRGETSFINEPYVTGGNPILSSKQGVMFTDMLGSTLNIGGKAIHMTAFGESSDTNAMYTGKPYIGELGYAFLFRNYRADTGKWISADPLGYPDGWNNLAYCRNNVVYMNDPLGLCQWVSETGATIPVPINEQNPRQNTPNGYTFVPCHSTVIVDTKTYILFPYYTDTIFVSCQEPLHVWIPRVEEDTGDNLHYVLNFYCGNDDIETHRGIQIIEITVSVYLNPEIRKYDCLRQETITYHKPDTSFELTYIFSERLIETIRCE